jgi:glycosyltransferase involved in cell wall biosynthesis
MKSPETLIKARRKIRSFFVNLAKRKVISKYDEYCSGKPVKNAILSFLVIPLLPPRGFRDRIRFSLRGMAQEIPRVLNELGYKVDVINFDNTSWRPKGNYDLFVGHGGINFENISHQLPEKATRIYLSTGIYWKQWNFRMAKRLYDIALRKAYLLMPERFIKYSEEFANINADGIICLGNQEAVNTYAQFRKVIGINTAFFPIKRGKIVSQKDFDEGRHHFLFFSGGGNVHKGLDLLIEAFSEIPLHLHICQHMQEEFFNLYRRELTQFPNIHVHGFIRMRSQAFWTLINRCNWVVSASCAEGQAGAIIECMAYGLIPILSDSNNIDLEGWGIRLKECNVEGIRSTAIRASSMAVKECRLRSEAVIKATNQGYSIENFRVNFKRAVEKIIFSADSRHFE